MRIVLNGRSRELDGPVSVSALLEQLGLSRDLVAVELNRRILRRTELEDTSVSDGDEVEVVHFVGGG